MAWIAVLAHNTDVLQVLREALHDHGWDVQPYPDAPAFAATLRHRRADLVVVDVSPREGEAGWETLARLKADYATASLPVVVSSDAFLDLQNHMDRLQDVAAVLVRPCSQEDILRCVSAAQNWSSGTSYRVPNGAGRANVMDVGKGE